MTPKNILKSPLNQHISDNGTIRQMMDIFNTPCRSAILAKALGRLYSALAMNDHLKKRFVRIAALSVIGLCIGAAIGLMQIQNQNAQVINKGSFKTNENGVAGISVGGPFSLTDHTGKAATEADYAGRYKLIYFGFTYCPAICPTELQKITRALNDLGEEGQNIQPLFITIDPERDTVETMRSYVELFHPRLIGLTGSREQIDAVLKNYRVFANRVQTPEMSDYTMDHSSFIYLMSPDDALISLYRIEDSAAFIVDDIRNRLSGS